MAGPILHEPVRLIGSCRVVGDSERTSASHFRLIRSLRNVEIDMITRRRMTALAASLLLPGLVAACVSAQKYDNLEAEYNQA